ncbi:restriction endonuclease subunit S [Streptomyces hygroscopicus]|uniref:restriction endonuclease subunit S n=1 Tax=Streptomyces hygroscopicus TaxID=1912 RepID=UPI003691B445
MSESSTRLLKDLVREVKPGFACGEVDANGIFQIRMNNVTKSGDIDLSKQRRVPRNHPGVGKNKLLPGDVLFNATNSPDLVGKTLFWSGIDEEVVYSNHFQRIRTDEEKLDSKYLSRWLACQFESGIFRTLCKQWVNQATVSKESLLALRVPLPPLLYQKRIAAVLDQVDILRAKRREAIALLDDLTQSVFLDMFGDPSINSCGFEVRELETLVAEGDRINYGVVQPGRHVEDGIPLIRSGDLGRFGVDRSSLMRISPDVESSYSRSRIKGNEILVGCVGAIGEVSIVGPDDVGSNVARAVARVPVAGDVDREYLAAYLRMDFAQYYFTRELRTVAQPTLNIKQIKSAPVVFPPSHLRSKFAERSRSVTQQRAVHVAHLAALDELFTSLQHRAFSGALWDHEALDEAA